MVQVKAIKALSDNYIWCLTTANSDKAWVVDPGQAAPVIAYLNEQQLTLAGILITHHHYDHTDGVAALVEHFANTPVYGPTNSPFKGVTHPLRETDKVTVLGTEFTIIETPGHTLDHICYLNDKLAFTGDTLFSGGCGRLFEGTAMQMYYSLNKLKNLPNNCQIYCTHEYTQANLEFALSVEPTNPQLIDYNEWVIAKRKINSITLPTNIGQEIAINPFLRSDLATIVKFLPEQYDEKYENSQHKNEPWHRFASLRRWKDHF